MLGGVAAAGAMRKRHVADAVKKVAVVNDAIADDVDDLALFLHPPLQADHGRRHHGAALRLEAVGPQDPVGDAGLVLDRDEQDALGRSGLLADQDDAGDLDVSPVSNAGEIRAAGDAAARQLVSHERQRMRAKRQLQIAVILDHLAAVGERAELHLGLDPFRTLRLGRAIGCGE